jgi:protein-S-isoprenylcysteine O-methyltransferase Ste14
MRSGVHRRVLRNAMKLTAWERLGGFFFRQRGVTPLVLVALALFYPTRGGLSLPRGLTALVLVLAGEWIRLRAVGVAGKCTRTRGKNVKELVTSGLFAHVRNPLYIGNFVLGCGLVVLSKIDWLLWVFPIVFFFQYAAIVAWEQRILLESFGEKYERYRREVPAWIPRPAAYANQSDHVYRHSIALQSERDSLRAVLLLGAALLLKQLFFNGSFGGAIRCLLAPG